MSSLIDRFRKPSKPDDDSSNSDTLPSAVREAREYLRVLSDKMLKLADDFAQGRINRTQFEELYRHYVRERSTVLKMLQEQPATPAWKGAVTSGESMLIKRKHAAQPLGYAIYLNANNALMRSVGDFNMDRESLTPMLAAYRAATTELFGGGLKSGEIEGGRWICFVPGTYTTLIVLFSIEPARLQMEMLEQLHTHFERANQPAFEAGVPDATKLVYPHAAAFE